jgi:hypothetical protein
MVTTRSNIRNHRRSSAGCRAHRRLERAHARPSRRSVKAEDGRLFFSGRISQHMETSRVGDWLGGGALLVAAASWGLLISLLGS